MNKYILGVDGGNTKTDYFLFTSDLKFVDHGRYKTCSHEALPDSFDGTYRVLKEVLTEFLGRNKLNISDISAACFGLAGVDTPFQKKMIEEKISLLGFTNFYVANDSFLGVKAVGKAGVCSICGTGTSVGGIDEKGNYLQVGGIGAIVGDEAGGSWLARRAIRQTFDSMYRFGKPSMLDSFVMNELGVTDKYYLMESISEKLAKRQVNLEKICKQVFEFANQEDEVSINILKEMADNLARSCGGCVVNLDLGENPLVVLAGSVWAKGSCPVLVNEFKKLINEYTNKKCNVVVLDLPPATGAIMWAFELLNGDIPSNEEKRLIVEEITERLNKC